MVEPTSGATGTWAQAVLLVGYKKKLDSHQLSRWFFHIKNSWNKT